MKKPTTNWHACGMLICRWKFLITHWWWKRWIRGQRVREGDKTKTLYRRKSESWLYRATLINTPKCISYSVDWKITSNGKKCKQTMLSSGCIMSSQRFYCWRAVWSSQPHSMSANRSVASLMAFQHMLLTHSVGSPVHLPCRMHSIDRSVSN